MEWGKEGLGTAGRARAKRDGLRAFRGTMEGLYPLEGTGWIAGVFEGFMGRRSYPKGERVSEKFAGNFFGGIFL